MDLNAESHGLGSLGALRVPTGAWYFGLHSVLVVSLVGRVMGGTVERGFIPQSSIELCIITEGDRLMVDSCSAAYLRFEFVLSDGSSARSHGQPSRVLVARCFFQYPA